MFLQDLTFIDDGNKNLLCREGGVELVSFDKRLKYASVIQDIMLFQSVGYDHIVEVPAIQAYLLRFMPLSGDKMYARSLLMEPRT